MTDPSENGPGPGCVSISDPRTKFFGTSVGPSKMEEWTDGYYYVLIVDTQSERIRNLEPNSEEYYQ